MNIGRVESRLLLLAPATVLLAMLLASCSRAPTGDGPPEVVPSGPLAPDAVPRVEPRSRYGNPDSYQVFGRNYRVMQSSVGYTAQGMASWYGRKFHGRRTSSGEPYDMHKMTAAHRSLPLPTFLEVTNLENGARAIVRVNDRGPFHDDRVIDLSYAAARKLGIVARGTGHVRLRAIDPRAPAPRLARAAAPRASGMMAVSRAPRAMDTPPAPGADDETSSRLPRIYVQAGAFAEPHNAHRLRTRLVSITDLPVSVQQLASPPPSMHRVRIGPLSDVVSADRLTQELAEAGLTTSRIVID